MGKINWPIPVSKSEFVRDAIAAILTLEFNNQVLNYYAPELEIGEVFIERSMPMDKTELPVLNVCTHKGNFDNKNQGSVDGMWLYYIYGQVNHEATDTEFGDKLAMIKLQRIMNAAKYILEDPIFKTLGFVAPFLSTSIVSEIEYSGADKNDGLSTVFGRLTYAVKLPESNKLLKGVPSNEFLTQVKMDLTEDGYQFVNLSNS